MQVLKSTKSSLAVLWVFAVLFFAYQFILRLAPGVLMHELTHIFKIDAKDFGYLSGMYYLGYAFMQIPMGIILDRFRVKSVIIACSVLCIIGNGFFIISDNWYFPLIGRLLIGIGSSGGALGSIKAAKLAFGNHIVPKMIGWSIAIGLFGAINGAMINEWLVHTFGFKGTIVAFMVIGLVITAVIAVVVKEKSEHNQELLDLDAFSSLRIIVKDFRVWMIALSGALLVGPLEAFADTWGRIFLYFAYGMSLNEAGYLATTLLYIGMCIGSFLLPFVLNYIRNYHGLVFTCGLVMIVTFGLILFKSDSGLSFRTLSVMTFLLGFMSAYQVIIFASISAYVPLHMNSVSVAFVNMINMIGGWFFNHGVGYITDYSWTGEMNLVGIKIYSLEAYRKGLMLILICLVIGAAISAVLAIMNGKKEPRITQ